MPRFEKVRELLKEGVECIRDEKVASSEEAAELRAEYDAAVAELDAAENDEGAA